jgi:surfeit locus 1 family protein
VLAALPALALLLALGTWQVQRLHWKEGVLARLAEAERAPPLPLDRATPQPWTKVRVTGRFDNGHEALLGAEVRGTRLGAQLVTPLLRPGAPPLLVLRGWVPLERGQPIERPEGEVTLTGYIRQGETPSWISVSDDTAGRHFYTFDPAVIARALGLAAVEPYGLVVLGPPGDQRLPVAATVLPRPDNPHLGYAGTWYGLALTLLGVLGAFTWRRWKETP